MGNGNNMGILPSEARRIDGCVRVWGALLGVTLGLLMNIASAAANSASAALGRGDYTAAFAIFSAHAEGGDPIAQNNLGVLYLQGRGTQRDYGYARVWFERAAQRGLAGAMYNLGIMYLRGYGMSKAPAIAAHWLEQAAMAGDREAQFSLGLLFYRGEGVARDLGQARAWFTRAADQGLPDAAYNLAVMQLQGQGGTTDAAQAAAYLERSQHDSERSALLLAQLKLERRDDPAAVKAARDLLKRLADSGNPEAQFHLGMAHVLGQGMPRDFEEGRFWLQQAARQGLGVAQLNLGNIYVRGLGTDPDLIQAWSWFSLGAANGESAAAASLVALRGKLNAEQIARAETLTAELRAKHTAILSNAPNTAN